MKEIIYLDSEMINSYLAQIDSGLMEKVIETLSVATSESEELTKTGSNSGGMGPNFFHLSKSSGESSKDGVVYSNTNSELKQIIFHDFSLDVLIDRLKSSELINEDLTEGAVTLNTGDFVAYDFERFESSTTKELMTLFDDNYTYNEEIDAQIKVAKSSGKKGANNIVSQLRAQKKPVNNNLWKNIEPLHKFAKFANAMFPRYCLIRINNLICLCPKSSMRISDATLTLLNETSRKITVLGVVIAKFNDERIKKYMDIPGFQFENQEVVSSMPNMLAEILLGHMSLCSPGDYYIRPIAIYFE